ncbi:hypothetical protein GGF31_001333 [Allomyces arbusculus]|nr:hypothetical protein GGF31_001333 [Allomyces arbusculus]
MNIDELFRAPAPKRKAELGSPSFSGAPPAKLQKTGARSAQPRNANVEDVPDDDDDGMRNGESAADAMGEDEVNDDRFFGDGLSEQERHIYDLVDQAENVDVAELDASALKKVMLRFDKALTKNQGLRAKHPDEPTKFIDSEIDLDAEARSLAILATAPHLYRDAIQLGMPQGLIALLTHDNPDIGIAALEVIGELTDDDVINPEEAEIGVEDLRGIREFVAALLEQDLLQILEAGYRRDLAAEPEPGQDPATAAAARDETLWKYLTVLENLLAVDESLADRILTKTTFMPYFIETMREKAFTPLRSYIVELLATMAQQSDRVRDALIAQGAVDSVLLILSAFRKRNPDDADHAEYLANAFSLLCCLLGTSKGQSAFRAAEGLELMALMIQARQMARIGAIRVLNYATLPLDRAEAVHMAVHAICTAQVLKCVFPVYMGADQKKMSRAFKAEYRARADEEHAVSTVVNLLRAVTMSGVDGMEEDAEHRAEAKQRMLRKFAEHGHEKVIQALDLFVSYRERVATVDADQEDEDQVYLDQLEKGLFTLSQLALLLAILCRETAEFRDLVEFLLDKARIPSTAVAEVLASYLGHADPAAVQDVANVARFLTVDE